MSRGIEFSKEGKEMGKVAEHWYAEKACTCRVMAGREWGRESVHDRPGYPSYP